MLAAGFCRMSGAMFDCCVTDAVLGRLDGRRLPDVFRQYGVPTEDQWSALSEVLPCDEFGKVRTALVARIGALVS